jgi:hypothetical protein
MHTRRRCQDPLAGSGLAPPALETGRQACPKARGREGLFNGAVMRWLSAHVKRACGPPVAMRGRSWIYYEKYEVYMRCLTEGTNTVMS